MFVLEAFYGLVDDLASMENLEIDSCELKKHCAIFTFKGVNHPCVLTVFATGDVSLEVAGRDVLKSYIHPDLIVDGSPLVYDFLTEDIHSALIVMKRYSQIQL